MSSKKFDKLVKTDSKIWDRFLKEEEYNPTVVDEHGRFPYQASKFPNIQDPIVSAHLINNGWNIYYPKEKNFTICLTHDVDVLNTSFKRTIFESGKSLVRFQINEALKRYRQHFNKKINPLWNFTETMDLEEKYGAKSSFYFLVSEKGEPDYRYNIESVRSEMLDIHQRGWEVGLHGGNDAHIQLNVLKREKKTLESVLGHDITGYRSHYLKILPPVTWEILKDGDFEYDTTYGYASQLGFRNGMCHPFKPFNIRKNEYIDILEIPLVIMDTTISGYLNLDVKTAWERIERLLAIVKKYKGAVSILWHNVRMQGDMLRLYEKILNYCYEQNAWLTSCKELYEWWILQGFSDES